MKRYVAGMVMTVVAAIAIEVGSVPPAVTLSGDTGGRTDGSPWHSTTLKGKVYVFFYVDPDEKDLNKAFVQSLIQALEERHFDRKKYASVAVVNLAATWKPNIIIETLLKKKQKEFPDTVYVKDKKRVLVKQWKLADNNSDVLVFDKNGKLIYKKFGKLSDKEIQKVLWLIETNQ